MDLSNSKMSASVPGPMPVKADFKCTECEIACGSAQALRQHALCHNRTADSDRFKCSLCSFSVTLRFNLKRHMQRAHPNALVPVVVTTDFTCNECDIVCGSAKALRQHALCHTGTADNRFKCDECSFSATFKWNLKRHMQRAHVNSRNILPHQDVNVEAKTVFKKKTRKEQVVYGQEELERNCPECESPEDEKDKSATAKPRVTEPSLRKRRSFHDKNVRAKKRHEASGTSQTEKETTLPLPENETGVDIGPTTSGADAEESGRKGSGGSGPSSKDKQSGDDEAIIALKAACDAFVKYTLDMVQIKNREYVGLKKTLPTP